MFDEGAVELEGGDRQSLAVDRPWMLDGTRIDVGVSIGIVVTDSGDDVPSDLMSVADAAMYRAKRITGSAWVRDPDRPTAGTRA